MEQLLSIKRIPIKIEVNVTNAQLKPKVPTDTEGSVPAVKVSKQNNGGLRVAAQPCKIDISSTKNFDSYTPAPTKNDGVKLTYNAIAKMRGSQQGEAQTVKSKEQIAAVSASRSIEAILSKLPKSKESSMVSYDNGTLSINYSLAAAQSGEDTPDLSGGFEFVPGSIDFIISQMPDLEIEYLGEPIYFPRSADPNYQGEMDLIV